MKVLAVADDPAATITAIRLREPLSALCADEGWPLAWRATHACTSADLGAADVLVLQRGTTERAYGLVQRMSAGGGRVVYEIDDLLTAPAPHLLHRRALERGRPWIERSLAAADAVTVTTARLASALQPLARRIEIVPNHAPAVVPHAAAPDAAAPLTLLVVASDRVDAGFLAGAIGAAARARPGRLRVVCVGPAALVFEGVEVEQRALMARPAFFDFVAALVNPLALIAVDDSPFSACKSAIKFFDYAAIGVPVICSRLPPYGDAVIDGHTGVLAGNAAAAWTAALLAAVDDRARSLRLAEAAAADVAARFALPQTLAAWRRVLASLGERQAAAAPPSRLAMLAERARLALRAANRARLARRKNR